VPGAGADFVGPRAWASEAMGNGLLADRATSPPTNRCQQHLRQKGPEYKHPSEHQAPGVRASGKDRKGNPPPGKIRPHLQGQARKSKEA
jgi:hypothetical protein